MKRVSFKRPTGAPFILESIFSEQQHFDVEIRTSEGCFIKSHSAVLAASTEFLRNCIEETCPGKLPVICLPDVRIEIVKYLLTYIYTGKQS